MRHVVDAIYEDSVLMLERPLPLNAREKVRVTVESLSHTRHSVLDVRTVTLGEALSPWAADDDLLAEMLEGAE